MTGAAAQCLPVPAVVDPRAEAAEQECRGRVLLVEDAVDLNTALAHRLWRERFDVVQAFDGIEALGHLGERVDAMILDLGLPGLSGGDLLRLARSTEQREDLPVLVITGREDPDVFREVRKHGVREVLLKPFTHRSFLQAVRRALSGPTSLQPPPPT